MVGPWITFVSPSGIVVRVREDDVGDIEYLATIESGNGPGNATLKEDDGSLSVTGTLATITAGTGKD